MAYRHPPVQGLSGLSYLQGAFPVNLCQRPCPRLQGAATAKPVPAAPPSPPFTGGCPCKATKTANPFSQPPFDLHYL